MGDNHLFQTFIIQLAYIEKNDTFWELRFLMLSAGLIMLSRDDKQVEGFVRNKNEWKVQKH